MNRLGPATVLVSAIAAVLLWLLASWIEGNPPWRAPEISGTEATGDPSPAAPDPQIAAAENCHDVEQEMRDLVRHSRSCVSDADCAILDYGYPIECLTSVARSEISSLRTAFRRYHRSCEYRVYYDCPTGDVQRRPVCRNRTCSVELTALDSLKDQTLDHLGLQE